MKLSSRDISYLVEYFLGNIHCGSFLLEINEIWLFLVMLENLETVSLAKPRELRRSWLRRKTFVIMAFEKKTLWIPKKKSEILNELGIEGGKQIKKTAILSYTLGGDRVQM